MAIDLGDAVVKVKADTKAMMTSLGGLKKQVGIAMAAVGTGIVVGLGKAVKSAATFEQAITNAASVTGKTGDEFEKARDKMSALAITLGEETKFSASEAADALYDLASKGFDVAGMSAKELKPILDLAAATQNDLTGTTEIVTATLRGFGLENAETTRIADVMTAAIGDSAAKMDRFAVSMPIVSSTAKTLNISLEETVAVLGTLYDKGINASTSATAFRNVAMDLNAKIPRITKGFEAVGISLDGIDVSTQGVVGAFQKLKERGLTAQQALAIFGKRTGNAAAALVGAADDADAFRKSLHDVGGKAAEVGGIQLDTLQGQLDLARGKFETLQIVLATHFIPGLTTLFTKIGNVISATSKWAGEHPALTSALVKLTGIIGVGMVAGGLCLALSKVALLFKGVALAVKGVSIAVAFLTAHPLVALVTFIAGALTYTIVEIIKHWDDFKWAIKEVGRVIAEAFAKMKEAVGNFFDSFTGRIVSFLGGPFTRLLSAITRMGLRSWFLDAMDNMAEASRIAFSSIASDIQSVLVRMSQLRFAASRMGWSEITAGTYGGLRRGMGQTAGWIRRMISMGQIDPAEIRAEIAAAEEQRALGRAQGVGAEALNQIQQYITWLTTLLTAEQRALVNVETMNVDGEEDAVAVGVSLFNELQTVLTQGGTATGFA